MLQKVLENFGRKNKIFAAVLFFEIFGMVLSGCASRTGKSAVADDGKGSDVLSNDVQLRNGQEAFEGQESATGTEIPKVQEDTGEAGGNPGSAGAEGDPGLAGAGGNHQDMESSDGDSGVVDDEGKELGKYGNHPTKEPEPQKTSGASGNVSETMEEGQKLSEEGQEQTEGKPQEKEQEGTETEDEDTGQAWKSAYLEVIYHLRDYLAPRYDPLSHEDWRADDDPMNIGIFYLGLHDFDGDGTLELITGDGLGLGVFTYEDGRVKKIADLCQPDLSRIWCVNGVDFKGNSIRVASSGSGGEDVVNFGYLDGEYVLGHYNEQTPTDPITINGREATMEEIEKIYTADYDKIEAEERRERFHLTNENGTWILKATWWSDEESVLDIDFDFDSVMW